MAQEEEVQGKKHELEALKEEEKTLLEDIKKTEKELTKLEQNLNIAQDLRREVFICFHKSWGFCLTSNLRTKILVKSQNPKLIVLIVVFFMLCEEASFIL